MVVRPSKTQLIYGVYAIQQTSSKRPALQYWHVHFNTFAGSLLDRVNTPLSTTQKTSTGKSKMESMKTKTCPQKYVQSERNKMRWNQSCSMQLLFHFFPLHFWRSVRALKAGWNRRKNCYCKIAVHC